ITEQDLVMTPQQYVLRLDVAMNQLVLMGVLQGLGQLPDIADNGGERQVCPAWMALAECAVGGVGHDQERRRAVYPKIQYTDNMWMLQAGDGASLGSELLDVTAR